jgi:hypothetical protein
VRIMVSGSEEIADFPQRCIRAQLRPHPAQASNDH